MLKITRGYTEKIVETFFYGSTAGAISTKERYLWNFSSLDLRLENMQFQYHDTIYRKTLVGHPHPDHLDTYVVGS